MANLSDASGLIRFEGFEEDIDFLKEFKLLMYNAFSDDETQYFINFLGENEDVDELNISDSEEEPFFAMGRWTFGNSLRNFFENISYYINDKYIHEENGYNIVKEKLHYIKEKFESNKDMSIVFDFTDYEPGMEILLEGLVSVRPVELSEAENFDGKKLILSTFTSEDFSELDVTVENLIETGMFENEDFLFPEDINFVDEGLLPDPEDLGLEFSVEPEEIRKELIRIYMERNETYSTREFRTFRIN